ncbi:MAG TPA: hypothetical protein VHN12_01265 [Geobacteraceae bacterium]|nr:hypothetical protein [Geobacteraceae bacterium]
MAANKQRKLRNQRRLLHRCRERRDNLVRLVRLENPEHLVRLVRLEHLHRHQIKIRRGISGYILSARIYPESMENG